MELTTFETILHLLNDLEPVGILALLAGAVFVWVWRNPFTPVQKSMTELKDNHLHELPELVENSRRTVDVLQRIEVRLGEDLNYLKGRINGK